MKPFFDSDLYYNGNDCDKIPSCRSFIYDLMKGQPHKYLNLYDEEKQIFPNGRIYCLCYETNDYGDTIRKDCLITKIWLDKDVIKFFTFDGGVFDLDFDLANGEICELAFKLNKVFDKSC